MFGKSTEDELKKETNYNVASVAVQTTRVEVESTRMETDNIAYVVTSGEFSRRIAYDLYFKDKNSEGQTLQESLLLCEKLICQTAFRRPAAVTALTPFRDIKSQGNDKAVQVLIRSPTSAMFAVAHGDREETLSTAVNAYSLSNTFWPERRVTLPKCVLSAAFNPVYANVLVVGCDDGALELLDLKLQTTFQTENIHPEAVTGVAFRSTCAGFQMLISCSLDGLLAVWRFAEGRAKIVYQLLLRDAGTQLDKTLLPATVTKEPRPQVPTALAAGDCFFAIGFASGSVQVFEYYEDRPLQTMPPERNGHGAVVYRVKVDGKRVTSCAEDGTVRQFSVGDAMCVSLYQGDEGVVDFVQRQNVMFVVTHRKLMAMRDGAVCMTVPAESDVMYTRVELLDSELLVGRSDAVIEVYVVNFAEVKLKLVVQK